MNQFPAPVFYMLHTTPEAIDAHLNILDSLDVEDAHFVETFCTICYNSRINNSYTNRLVDRHYVTTKCTTCKLENELSESLDSWIDILIVEEKADLARFQ